MNASPTPSDEIAHRGRIIQRLRESPVPRRPTFHLGDC